VKNLLLFLLIVILILSKDNQCFAQSFNSQNEVDSINKIITSENVADTSLAQAYLLLSELTTEEGLDTMISLCSQVELIVLKGLKTPNKKIKNSLLASLAGAYNNIGYTHYHQGEIVLSLEYYHKSLTIYEKLNSERGVADCYTNLGNIYTKQQNYKKAIDFFSKSLIIYEAVDYKIGVATCLNNLGGIYNSMKKFDKALTFYNRSLKILTELNVKNGVAATLNNIGTIYRAQNKNIQALEYYNKSLVILEELGNKKGLAYSLKNIAAIMYLQKNLKDANDYAKRSLMISTKIGYPENIKNVASLLSKIYQKQGNYKEALAMRNLEIQMRDSLNNESTQKAAAQQQAKYEYEKQKTIDDAAHDKQIALEQEEQKKQRIISISIAIGLLLVVIFLLFVFNRLRITRKQKIVIEQQHDEVEEAHKEIRDSINYAERIQRSFLASDELLNNNLKDYFVFFHPKDVVSGDFYWAGA
jgi:tetratricopeptide (TPR) repeat protein